MSEEQKPLEVMLGQMCNAVLRELSPKVMEAQQLRRTLRDEFAKAALMRMTDPEWDRRFSQHVLAAKAYEQADAMLFERDKAGGE